MPDVSKVSANVAFLAAEFPFVAEGATLAERAVYADPRAACFHARHTLEQLLKRLFYLDRRLGVPANEKLDGLLNASDFRKLAGDAVWQKAEYIRRKGNDAVHAQKAPTPAAALAMVRELYHVLYWAGRNYTKNGAHTLAGAAFDETLIPQQSATPAIPTVPLATLEAMAKQKDEAEARSEAHRRELETQIGELQARIEQIRAENEKVPDTHDYDERTTRERLIDLDLHRAGWTLEAARDREYEVTGMPTAKGIGYADYVLWGDDGRPLAVVEAKKTLRDARAGQQQAKLYADCLEAMHGQRPLIYYTNGYTTWLWDDRMYPPREVAGFAKKDELDTLIRRREQRQPLDVAQVKGEIAGRYFQKRVIGSIAQQFANGHRKALLVMATGTGKTRTAIALVDLMQRANWVKRALFLCDRQALVIQSVNAFKAHLAESTPVNLLTEKDKTGRVYVSTYQTMMGLIDDTQPGGNEARFGVGHFDLIIIDEAHRSVYQKFKAIFQYFDSLLVGLTATPREQVDKNTYDLFGLPAGVPTDAYELETAVRDGFLVPPKARQVDMKYPRRGIKYKDLSDAEKEQWESADWGDNAEEVARKERVDPEALNNWLFNTDTVDKALHYLMEHGHKVQKGDRLAKTIIFARNQDHADFIADRFNHHYPKYKGHFAQVISYRVEKAQSLIDAFAKKDESPHIAISVDMLDTGIDVPEVANLVFFKPVYSKIKFWQMIGRGTRLCPDLFGPGQDKADFRIFDFCFNFDFFEINPDGIESSAGVPLGAKLFRSRVALISHTQRALDLDPDDKVRTPTTDLLHAQVMGMREENFEVRLQLEAVHRFKDRAAWNALSEEDQKKLEAVSLLPSDVATGEIESRLFDLLSLRMQLASVENRTSQFERDRKKAVDMAMMLEEKSTIPAVQKQLGYLQAMQETDFWVGITIAGVEEMRLRLRDLVPLLDKKGRSVVYTVFEDEIVGVKESEVVAIPTMTGVQYQKKVEQFLTTHKDEPVIRRLRNNQPLTGSDLAELETMLVKIGEADGKTLLDGLLAQSKSPSLAHFVRGLVGLDRAAAQAAFAKLLSNQSLTPQQIRFVELIIDQLTARGVMGPEALYEAPFIGLHAGGPEGLFAGKPDMVDGIFAAITQTQPFIQPGA
ncbi:MAG: DEAD/DEAH box helicase family protein [Tepidisphaeraceae bacterium]